MLMLLVGCYILGIIIVKNRFFLGLYELFIKVERVLVYKINFKVNFEKLVLFVSCILILMYLGYKVIYKREFKLFIRMDIK